MKKPSVKSTPHSTPVALQHHDETGLERLIFFSDAVFAIAITLLALEIRLPALPEVVSDAQLRDALLALAPKYLSYVISFMVIGIFWLGHHRTFHNVVRYDRRLLWLNLFLLLFIAFIPFPTAVIGEYGNRTGTIFYAATMTMTGILQALVWWYTKAGGRLLAQPLEIGFYRRNLLRVTLVPTIFLLSIFVAFWDADWAKWTWLLIAPATLAL